MIYTVTLNPALDREMTVPQIVFDEVLRATKVRLDSGGKGFNVSRALAALGKKSIALGFLGGGAGLRIAYGLEELGIRLDAVDIDGETRTNVSIVSEEQDHILKVNESGPIIKLAEREAMLQKVADLARPGDWWVLSGSLPRGVPETFYADIIMRVQTNGAKVMLDASGTALRLGCEALPFLVKPNAREAEELIGHSVESTSDAMAAARAIHELGASTVLVTMGARGGLISDGQRCWLAQAPQVELRSPVGAGDAALAGLLWALTEGLALPEALRWAMAAGAVAASLEGTAMGEQKVVESFVQLVKADEVVAGAE